MAGSNNMSGIVYGAAQQLVHIIGGGNITKVGITAAIVWPKGCRGRVKLRFRIKGADKTLGDGTNAHAIAIVGLMTQTSVDGAAAQLAPKPEMIGFAGIPLGNGAGLPQVPMLDAAGGNPREFAQIVELVPGYAQLGLAGFAADEPVGGANEFWCFAEPIIEE